MEKRRVLYLDDLRICPSNDDEEQYSCVRNYLEFRNWIDFYGLPDVLDLDHDLGEGETGYDCLKLVIENLLDHPDKKVPKLRIHSGNSVGRENMRELWNCFLRVRNS